MKGTATALTALAVAVALSPAATAQPPDRQTDFLDKAGYRPGETVKIQLGPLSGCGAQATSEGFAAPIELKPVPTATIGEGEAAKTPGTFQARIFCKAGSLVDSFTIAVPVTTTTPPPPSTQPKPPVKKPKGAPQTGGGGTA